MIIKFSLFEQIKTKYYYFENGIMIIYTDDCEKIPLDIRILYLYWLLNSSYIYHIDDSAKDISIFDDYIAKYLDRNINCINTGFNESWNYYLHDENKIDDNKDVFITLFDADIDWFTAYKIRKTDFPCLYDNINQTEYKNMIERKYPEEYEKYKLNKLKNKYSI